MKKIYILLFFIYLSCTNYSSKPLPVNPVILLAPPSGNSTTTKINAIEKTSTGHILRVAAQNTELTFKGYRIYQAPTEEQVLNLDASSGVDCGSLLELPNTGKIYIMEASTNPLGLATLCTFPVNLTSGYYVSIRVTYFQGIGQEDGTSMPSNALLIP
ncbi:MAG: hypothetical protein KatS3mg129_2595 [Leptospiraceae bacterium]|nr:MAG: hypothetical protein KatS3mg129_2595 [Leptospiraceae bacterium]